mmetsp:Transcript_12316/g.28859  ORF Transcript_12316/g.28859 Transcript_12316/m.28859 type:complete len:105 (-) Transcript_12316:711-1025(-)
MQLDASSNPKPRGCAASSSGFEVAAELGVLCLRGALPNITRGKSKRLFKAASADLHDILGGGIWLCTLLIAGEASHPAAPAEPGSPELCLRSELRREASGRSDV